MGNDHARKLAQLRQAYENGILDEDTYKDALSALSTPPIDTESIEGPMTIAQVSETLTVGQRSVRVKGNTDFVITGDQNIIIAAAGAAATYWQKFRIPCLSPEELQQVTQQYLAYLLDRYRYLDFKGMGVSDRVPLRLPLVEMYVPLKARVEMPEAETWGRGGDNATRVRVAGRIASPGEIEVIGGRLSEPKLVLEILQGAPGLIILGDPGSGKTTFLKYLALRLAAGEGPSLGLGVRLPILLPLSAYANALAERDIPLDRFIPAYYRDRGIDLSLDLILAEALAQGGVLLLLDGLDEVKDQGKRSLVVERVVDFFTLQQKRKNKFILTSRIVGYREVRPITVGLAECTLIDFDVEEIKQFVSKWTGALERAARGNTIVAAQDAAHEEAELVASVARNPGVRRLASNPLLLTILALMKRQGITLPERRVELYQKYIETLLKTWNLARGLGRPDRRDLDVVETLKVLAPLALWMHQTSPGVGLVKREAVRRELERIYGERGEPNPEKAAQLFLEDVRDHASLLLERGPGEYGFIHLTFQEYLAAIALAQQGQSNIEPIIKALALHINDDTWREVSLLTVGYLGIVQQRDEVAGDVVWRLIQDSPGETGRAVVLAGEAIVDSLPSGVDHQSKKKVMQALQWTIVAHRHVKPNLRSAAGNTLAKLGDARAGVGLRSDGLPDLTWCKVPAGQFTMGRGKILNSLATSDEFPASQVNLPTYYITRYPITNAQYSSFVKAGGYQQLIYWGEAERVGVWQDGRVRGQFDKVFRYRPEDFGEPFNLPNHPVVGITWYEALAFCRWLNKQIGRLVSQQTGVTVRSVVERDVWVGVTTGHLYLRLPSEAEWEKTARGTDDRLYPWGNKPDPNLANYVDTDIGSTSSVGCFPRGASPYGCKDMAGNVLEWCRTNWQENSKDSQKELSIDIPKVMRGGAFNQGEMVISCSFRQEGYPTDGGWDLGFRIVATPIAS